MRLPFRLTMIFAGGAILLHWPVAARPPAWEPVGDGLAGTLPWLIAGCAAGWVAGNRWPRALAWGCVCLAIPWMGALYDLLLLPLEPAVPLTLFAGGRLLAGALAFADGAVLLLILSRDAGGKLALAVRWAIVGAVWRAPLLLSVAIPAPEAVSVWWPLAIAARVAALAWAGWILGAAVEKHATSSR